MAFEYSKVLIQRDIDERFTVPELWMDLLAPLFMNGCNEALLRVVDCVGLFWEFRCSIRRAGLYNKPVLQAREWNKFVRYVGLRAGDRIVLIEDQEAQLRGTSYRITAQRTGDDGLWADVQLPERPASNLLRLL